MKKVMRGYLLGILAFFGVLTLWSVAVTIPFWLVWNYIIASKFELTTFTFFESFWITVVIKFLFAANLKVANKK
jgi:hypothetical protein